MTKGHAQKSVDVVVVGAGPVGLTAAAALARRGASVVVLEARPKLNEESKASTFHASTIGILSHLVDASSAIERGRLVRKVQWRDSPSSVVAELSFQLLDGLTDFPFRLHLEQSRLTPLLLRAASDCNAEVRFDHPVAGLESTRRGYVPVVGTPEGFVRPYRAKYVIAADGAHSTIRQDRHIGFEGFEYAHKVLRIMTTKDFEASMPSIAGITYLRQGNYSCSFLRMPSEWRLIFRVPRETPDSVALGSEALESLLRPLQVDPVSDVTQAHTFRTSKRVAETYQAGSVILLGDAAHLTTTAGGMNMNCGIHEAFHICNVLVDVMNGRLAQEALEAALRQRRAYLIDTIIPHSEMLAPRDGMAGGSVSSRDILNRVTTISESEELSRNYLRKASLLDPVGNIGDYLN